MDTTGKDDELSRLKKSLSEGEPDDELKSRIFDFVPGIVYVHDLTSKKLTYINKNISELLGYDYSDIYNLDDGLLSVVFKEDVDLFKEAMKACEKLELEKVHSYDCRMNSKVGNWKYFRTKGTVLRRDEKGRPLSLLFVSEDISEQMKSIEEVVQLRQLQSENENLLGYGILTWDIEKDSVKWSEGLYSIFEYTDKNRPESFTSAEFFGFADARDKESLMISYQHAIASKAPFNLVCNIITALGNKKVISIRSKVVENADKKVVKIISSLFDITEEISNKRELERYKEHIDEKERILGFGSWEVRLPDFEMEWSDGMYNLFGYEADTSRDAFLIDHDFLVRHFGDEQWANTKKSFELVAQGNETDTWEADITTKSGDKKRLQWFSKRVLDKDGKPTKIMGTAIDMTQLRSYQKNLELLVKELNRSNKELEEFAYIASHDLQEPLRKLSTFTERLVLRFSDQLGEEGLRYTDRILASSNSMRTLIDNLLEFSRISRLPRPFQKLELSKIINQVISEIDLSGDRNSVRFVVEDLPVLEAIPVQMQQLFSNLLNNAVKFRREEVDTVIKVSCTTLSTEKKKELSLSEHDKYFDVTVEDNGIGFEQEYAQKIFQIFQRLHGKVEYPGSGVGLAICKKIAENHQGLIYAESEISEGSVFHVILPEKHS